MACYVSAKADDDLDDIWFYIASESDSPERADRQIAAITDRFYLLAEYPFLGRSRPDLRADLRSLPVGNYVIIYKIDAVDVTILHVFPAMRDIANLT
jgi:toxin ParE1/3/4